MLCGQKNVPLSFVMIAPPPSKREKPEPRRFGKSVINFNRDYQFKHFSRGETLDFSIVLVGKAGHFWTQILVAVRLMAESGLGEETSRFPFTLISAFAHEDSGRPLRIFSRLDSSVSVYGVAPVKLARIVEPEIEATTRRCAAPNECVVEIEFLAPASRRIFNKTRGDLSFAALVKKIGERFEFLASLYSEPSQKIDYRRFLTDADEISLLDESLEFYLYEQDSARQGQTIRRDVFIGNVKYKGKNLINYLPLLKIGEILNVGTDTSHGMGKFAVKLKNP